MTEPEQPPRRASDPRDYDPRPYREAPPNGRHLPAWAQAVGIVGVPGLIALGLLGFIPGVPSPIDRIEASNRTAAEAVGRELRRNRATQGHIFQALYAICVRLPSHPQAPPCDLRTRPPDRWDGRGDFEGGS